MEFTDFQGKLDEMIPDLIKGIKKKAEQLYNSGGVDTNSGLPSLSAGTGTPRDAGKI